MTDNPNFAVFSLESRKQKNSSVANSKFKSVKNIFTKFIYRTSFRSVSSGMRTFPRHYRVSVQFHVPV